VIEAVLSLVKDKDEFIRRCAVEILITTRVKTGGEAIFTSLVDALDDGDWWVRERAIDALAGLGDLRAVPPPVRVMEQDVKAARSPSALASLGDRRYRRCSRSSPTGQGGQAERSGAGAPRR
jgi:serine/threonine-protein kinase